MMIAAAMMLDQLSRDTTGYDASDIARYARCVKASRRVRWDIDVDVIRGRSFDFSRKFLPDGLSKADELGFLNPREKILMSQIQGRTYAYLFGLLERYISVKILELASAQSLGNQLALEGLVRFSDEELKHQELFRRIEHSLGSAMEAGYTRTADPDQVARAVLAKSSWAVLALTCNIELFTQAHYHESIGTDHNLCPVFRDVFRYHWLEECQHAMIDEIEWQRTDRRMLDDERDSAVDDYIALVRMMDGLLQTQAAADTEYFLAQCRRPFAVEARQQIGESVLRAYRWQYIGSGARHPHFQRVLASMVTPVQMQRIQFGLAPLVAQPAQPKVRGTTVAIHERRVS
jgi:hypothetical protein